MTGFLCRCSVCGREERTGDNPLKNGWPMCHGYTMTLIDNEAFKEAIDRQMGEIMAPVAAMRAAAVPAISPDLNFLVIDTLSNNVMGEFATREEAEGLALSAGRLEVVDMREAPNQDSVRESE